MSKVDDGNFQNVTNNPLYEGGGKATDVTSSGTKNMQKAANKGGLNLNGTTSMSRQLKHPISSNTHQDTAIRQLATSSGGQVKRAKGNSLIQIASKIIRNIANTDFSRIRNDIAYFKNELSPSKEVNIQDQTNQNAIKDIVENKDSFKNSEGKFDNIKIAHFLSGRTNTNGEQVKSSINKQGFDNYFQKLYDLSDKYGLNANLQTGFSNPRVKPGQTPWKDLSIEQVQERLNDIPLTDSEKEVFLKFCAKDRADISASDWADFKVAADNIRARFSNPTPDDYSIRQKITNLTGDLIHAKSSPQGYLRMEPKNNSFDTTKERVYVCFNPEKAEQLMDLVLKELFQDNPEKYPGINQLKIAGPMISSCSDGLLFYITHKDSSVAEKTKENLMSFISQLQKENPDMFGTTEYAFKDQRTPFLAGAGGGDSSYTDIAATKIAEELNKSEEPEKVNLKKLNKTVTSHIEKETIKK